MNVTAGVIAALSLASTVASSQAQTAPPVRHPGKAVAVENLHYWETSNSVRVIVDISGEAEFRQGDAKRPDRVFVDIRPAKLNPALAGKQWPLKSNLLQQIRIGQYDNSTVRVVLHVGDSARVTSLALRDPDRLVIDLFPTESPSQPALLWKTAAASIPGVAPEAPESVPATSAPAGRDATTLPTPSTPRPSGPPQISAEATEAAA